MAEIVVAIAAEAAAATEDGGSYSGQPPYKVAFSSVVILNAAKDLQLFFLRLFPDNETGLLLQWIYRSPFTNAAGSIISFTL